LRAIGEHFVRAILAPENLSYFRIVVGEGRKFPEHLQRYISSGADRVRDVVSGFLTARGANVEDPDAAASYLLDLWRSRHHYRALADDAYRVSDAELSEYVAMAVRFFLRAARP
jgi:hypothetical protein